MAVDAALTARLRAALPQDRTITEKRMMGATCFFVGGNMIGAASRLRHDPPHFLFRLGKDNPAVDSLPGGRPAIMGDRVMGGFRIVDADDCDDGLLSQWAAAAFAYANGLPPK